MQAALDGIPSNACVAWNREEFRSWLEKYHATERECWLKVRRGNPEAEGFAYLDAVEEALCFGWIDGHLKSFPEFGTLQRFTPRTKGSSWSELNKERARRLCTLGLMTDAGKMVLPAMGPRSFKIDPAIVSALKEARCWSAFRRFPSLYQRVRADNVQRVKTNPEEFDKRLSQLIKQTKAGKMYGDWNDFGRLG